MRLPEQLDGLDGLVIPGGESTTIMRLAALYGLDEAIRAFDRPILGTCAGMIVLDRSHLGLVDFEVDRNAYGRQVASFEADLELAAATRRSAASSSARRGSATSGTGRGARRARRRARARARRAILVASFHPELTDDPRVHELFLELVREETSVRA